MVDVMVVWVQTAPILWFLRSVNAEVIVTGVSHCRCCGFRNQSICCLLASREKRSTCEPECKISKNKSMQRISCLISLAQQRIRHFPALAVVVAAYGTTAYAKFRPAVQLGHRLSEQSPNPHHLAPRQTTPPPIGRHVQLRLELVADLQTEDLRLLNPGYAKDSSRKADCQKYLQDDPASARCLISQQGDSEQKREVNQNGGQCEPSGSPEIYKTCSEYIS